MYVLLDKKDTGGLLGRYIPPDRVYKRAFSGRKIRQWPRSCSRGESLREIFKSLMKILKETSRS